MTEDRSPELQILFANAEIPLPDNGFAESVLTRIERYRRFRILRWSAIGMVLVALAALLAGPLLDLATKISGGLTVSLVPDGGGWIGQALAPLNTVAGLLALCLFGLQTLFRRLGR